MTDEKKKEYTLRISQANPAKLLVILYEMYESYMDDAINAIAGGSSGTIMKEGREAMHEGIRKARLCLNQLISTLDMEYEISGNLLSIYLYITKTMALADVKCNEAGLRECKELMGMLRHAYDSISHEDKSGPVMENSQTVYAGLTYGKSAMTESSSIDGNRGFLA